ncbi:hypothetical protein [Planctomycetes bacterium Poly30]
MSNPVELLARADKAAIREFSSSYHLAATNPEATALLIIRKYDAEQDTAPRPLSPGATGLGKGFRVGLVVATSKAEYVFQLPTLRTYLSLSLLNDPEEGNDKIVLETDLGEALTNLASLQTHLPPITAGLLPEPTLESALIALE